MSRKGVHRPGDKLLSVHSVRSAKIVLDLVERYLPVGAGTVVRHWFTGSNSEALRAADLGCFFSVNAQMASSERGRELIRSLPLDRLLTETDGPFTQIEGRPYSPLDIDRTVVTLGELMRVGKDEMTLAIYRNLKCLLGASMTDNDAARPIAD